MRNPNTVSTVIHSNTEVTIIEFEYGSASVAQHDFTRVQEVYSGSRVDIIGRFINVTIDNSKMMTYVM